jgi:hypothetical protein
VSCVPNVASFSGLSFCITPSVFSSIYLSRNWQHWVHMTQDKYMLENTEGVMKKDNREKLATLPKG